VVRATADLVADVARVTGATPAIRHDEKGLGANTVIAGTIGKSVLIDRLVREGKLDAGQIQGKWEAFPIQVVAKPLPVDALEQNSPRDWETTVKDSVRKVKTSHTLSGSGYHTLKFWMVDPALVLEKLVVNLGGVKPSYPGPPESYRGTK
jgi:hypothetical protein